MPTLDEAIGIGCAGILTVSAVWGARTTEKRRSA